MFCFSIEFLTNALHAYVQFVVLTGNMLCYQNKIRTARKKTLGRKNEQCHRELRGSLKFAQKCRRRMAGLGS